MYFFRFLFGIAVGAGVGYLAGRLSAPEPGVELKAEVRARYQSVLDEAQEASDSKRRELESRYQTAKRSGTYQA